MKPLNIFALTRNTDSGDLRRLERQLSKRSYFLRVKDWEISGLRELSDRLMEVPDNYEKLFFFYSFQIPKLGKEFDLLQITEDSVLNIELKSGEVTDEKVRNQLLLNRQYLALLGKTMHSYTYISSQNRLVRLTKSERLAEASWEELAEVLSDVAECYSGEIERLFAEDRFLISPLTDPDRFLRRDYFLTSQQRDIRANLLAKMQKEHVIFQGFTGFPGTGKTLLLYDLAMQLSQKDRVCVLHFGSYPAEMLRLDSLLKRIDFCYCQGMTEELVEEVKGYTVIFVDEGHRMTAEALKVLEEYAQREKIPVVFSYDCEEAICTDEREGDISVNIDRLPGYIKYRLTNRIRTNQELASFIQCLMQPARSHRRRSYGAVSVCYASTKEEEGIFLEDYKRNGYIYIRESNGELQGQQEPLFFSDLSFENEIDSTQATCKEFEQVVMTIGPDFYYDGGGRLRHKGENISGVRTLFHGLNRAKTGLALVITDNRPVFEIVLSILQGREQ